MEIFNTTALDQWKYSTPPPWINGNIQHHRLGSLYKIKNLNLSKKFLIIIILLLA
jgi:hypothetical protein